MKAHTGHGRVVCACGAVVRSCRCIESGEVIGTVASCPACQKTVGPAEWPRHSKADFDAAALECEQLERVTLDRAETLTAVAEDPLTPEFERAQCREHAAIHMRSCERYRLCVIALRAFVP